MSVAEGLARVEARIRLACVQAGRPRESVQLLAVSKLKPASAIREAYLAGQRYFGENYAQELRDKAEELADLPGLVFHAIGPLQTNKAKYVAKAAAAFHALDRREVAEELSKRRQGGPLPCFLEVNVGAEASKSGVTEAALPALLAQVGALPNLRVVGLMCLPPLGSQPEDARPYFRRLKRLADDVGLLQLSMGTTLDFEAAILEGSTCVRVGTAIFGER